MQIGTAPTASRTRWGNCPGLPFNGRQCLRPCRPAQLKTLPLSGRRLFSWVRERATVTDVIETVQAQSTQAQTAQQLTGQELGSQDEISAEIAAISAANNHAFGESRAQPLLDYRPYRSSILRHPTKAPIQVDPEGVELLAPVFGQRDVDPLEADLTIVHRGEPIGERMIITGRIIDGDGRPVVGQLVEIWQANAGGRYIHQRDQHPAPLDPNFTGSGRCLTGSDGSYEFTTIKPGPYPWKNHRNAWRPAHIHFSLFGTDFAQRIITQMYFPGDPLFALDPIYQSITDQSARDDLVAVYDHDVTRPEWCTGYRWNIVLTGSRRTWTETDAEHDQ
jgi:protocatechuate 3,4-dioxygenase beta subunit